MNLFNDDCLKIMRTMPDNSVDAIVTDPPAGIGFMGKDWDKNKGGREQWIAWLSERMIEALRVLKPGGHALVWSLPRTSHWTGFALEDAGFEVRDCVYHLFGTGFPKSLDISKAIDAMHGAEREVVGEKKLNERDNKAYPRKAASHFGCHIRKENSDVHLITAPATEDAQKWSGWGTALKPAVEQWWLVRKPLSEKTIVNNILKWGTGGLNIDDCRVPTDDSLAGGRGGISPVSEGWDRPHRHDPNQINRLKRESDRKIAHAEISGRFPANLTHDGSDCVVAEFPETVRRNSNRTHKIQGKADFCWGTRGNDGLITPDYNDNGFAARFFYCAKASTSDRNEGCDRLQGGNPYDRNSVTKAFEGMGSTSSPRKNHHPTVKSTELMRYFCRLITPPGGIILDPFMGSGSTGKAATLEGFDFIGIELDAEYFQIAQQRIEAAAPAAQNPIVAQPIQPAAKVEENQLRLI